MNKQATSQVSFSHGLALIMQGVSRIMTALFGGVSEVENPYKGKGVDLDLSDKERLHQDYINVAKDMRKAFEKTKKQIDENRAQA